MDLVDTSFTFFKKTYIFIENNCCQGRFINNSGSTSSNTRWMRDNGEELAAGQPSVFRDMHEFNTTLFQNDSPTHNPYHNNNILYTNGVQN